MTLPINKTRSEEVVAYVEAEITRRGLRPGDHIGTRAALREETNVARATINEAVRLLQERRRIALRPGPGGGLFVAADDPVVRLGRTLLTVQGEPSAVAEAIEVREQLEPLVAAHAAENCTPKDARELRSLMEKMSDNLDDVAEFLSINWDLHTRIAAISPNTVLRRTYVGLYEFVNHVSIVNSPQSLDSQHLEQRLKVHNDLVEAIVAGDVTAARLAGEAHRHTA